MLNRIVNIDNDNIFKILLFLPISFIYVFFTFPVYSTGDGAELTAVVSTFGLSHPPGYPLYTQLTKIFSFIPIGNLAERLSISTVFFSILSLYLLYMIVNRIVGKYLAAILAVYFLAFTYSYLGQSVVIKFYTLNLFLIALLIYILIDMTINDKVEVKKIVLSSFLIGLIASNHHTGLFMIIPFFIFFIVNKVKNINLFLFSFVFFLIGFSVNFYMFIRSFVGKGIIFNPVTDLYSFFYVFNRQGYSGSSLEGVGSGLNVIHFESLFFSLKNIFFVLVKNIELIGVILLFGGLYYVFKTNKKLFVILFSSFLMYGPFLAKITLSSTSPTIRDYYIQAHQYFLPFLFISVIFIGISIGFILEKLKKHNYRIAYYTLIFTFISLPLLHLFSRYYDQNFNKNYVPYYFTKSYLTTLPISSVFITEGDQINFGIWYLKRFASYRQDVCALQKSPISDAFNTFGCWPISNYRDLLHRFSNDNINLSKENKIYSYTPFSSDSIFKNFYKSKYAGLHYLVVPKDTNIENYFLMYLFNNKMKYLYTCKNECENNMTDDFYTIELCRKLSLFFAYYSKILSDMGYKNESDMFFKTYIDISNTNDINKSFYSESPW